jgi:hypothetical protein
MTESQQPATTNFSWTSTAANSALVERIGVLERRVDELERKFARAQGGVEQSLEPPFGEFFKDKP